MPDDQHKAYDVFLSHAHSDAAIVEKLAALLEDQHDIRVWLDKWVLIPGEHWQQGMAKGLDEAASCAVCIRSKELQGWFKEEIERALNRQTKDTKFRVIPVILPDGDRTLVDQFLELRTWVEFTNGIEDPEALRILLAGILGKVPGRSPGPAAVEDEIKRLEVLRDLRNRQLIHEQIAMEFERQLVQTLLARRVEH
jgi:hypothetical protein